MSEKPTSASNTFYPESVELAESNLILEAWQRKPDDGNLWFVFVSCNQGGQPQRFVYSFIMPPEIDSKDVVGCTQRRHKELNRPTEVDSVEVLNVTQEIVGQLKAHRCFDKDKGLCDFCGIHEVLVMTYSAQDFVMQDGRMSMGGWKACATCAALIDDDDRDGLAERIAVTLRDKMAQPKAVATRQVADFFTHRLFQ